MPDTKSTTGMNGEDYDPTRTPARLKFQLNDRIQLSAAGLRQGLTWKIGRSLIKSGWVVGFPRNDSQICVKRNGLKTPVNFHIDLWEKVDD